MSGGLSSLWSDWERRLAVVAGALVALFALAQHCPVWVACARGGAALVFVALLARGLGRLLAWSLTGDRQEAAARAAAIADAGRPALDAGRADVDVGRRGAAVRSTGDRRG